MVCKSFVEFSSAPRPSANARLAIFFPRRDFRDEFRVLEDVALSVGGTKLVWVSYRDSRLYIVEKSPAGAVKYIDPLGGEKSDQRLIRQTREDFPSARKTVINRCCAYMRSTQSRIRPQDTNINILLATKRRTRRRWNGPVLIVGWRAILEQGASLGDISVRDVSLFDLSMTVNFFRAYDTDESMARCLLRGHLGDVQNLAPQLFRRMVTERRPHNHSTKGVIISSSVGFVFLSKSAYIEDVVAPDHLVYTAYDPALGGGFPTEVSPYMGLPLLAQKVNTDIDSFKESFSGNFEDHLVSRTAASLNVILNPKCSGWWGVPNYNWERTTDSVLVVRQDRKDITTHQVEALAMFCRNHIPLLVQDVYVELSKEGTENQAQAVRQQFIDKFSTRAEFEKFFGRLKKMRVDGGVASWADAVSFYAPE